MRNYDLEFLKRFSMIIGFLMLVTLGLIAGAFYLHGTLPKEISPTATRLTQQRIAPVGAVYAGATGAAAQAAAKAAATAAAASQVAYGGTLDGGVIYQNLCGACHTNGVGGAPRLIAAGMGARASKGLELLYSHSIQGFQGEEGIMPAKGGNPALTDEQVQVTVDWMLANVQ